MLAGPGTTGVTATDEAASYREGLGERGHGNGASRVSYLAASLERHALQNNPIEARRVPLGLAQLLSSLLALDATDGSTWGGIGIVEPVARIPASIAQAFGRLDRHLISSEEHAYHKAPIHPPEAATGAPSMFREPKSTDCSSVSRGSQSGLRSISRPNRLPRIAIMASGR